MKKVLAFVLAICMTLALVACGEKTQDGTGQSTDGETVTGQTAQYRFGTSANTGTYYVVGGVMSSIMSKSIGYANFTAEATNGTVENIRRMNAGELDIATTANDSAYMAYYGEGSFEAEGKQNISGVFNLYNTPFQIVTLEKSNIRTVADLEGKKVSVGQPGSGGNVKCELFLSAFGYEDGKNITYVYLDYGEAAEALKDGSLDVAMTAVGIPSSSIQELCTSYDVFMVPFEENELQILLDQVPYFSATVIPANTYTGIDYDVLTFGCGNTISVRSDMDEQTVYDMCKAICENYDEFMAGHASLASVSKEDLPNTIIPLHPGAERYYKDTGLLN